MKNNLKLLHFYALVLLFFIGYTSNAQTSAVYGGGSFYSGGQPVMDDLRNSGFNTIILWTIHVSEFGNMNFNDIPVIDTNGNYIGDPEWGDRIATLKQAPTSVTRVELGIASAGATDFENIETLINANGTGPETTLYKAFKNLKDITNVDAVNFDDESNYDVSTTVQFAVMLADIGYKVTLVPYTRRSFWQAVYTQVEAQRPGTIDKVYLQVYAGGAGNNPSSWNGAFGPLKVIPGLWSINGDNCNRGSTPAAVQSRMSGWKNDISGGFMWLYDDIEKCSAPGRRTADYANAINTALANTPPPPPPPSGTSNLAPSARITVSSEYVDPNWSKEKLTDGIIGQNANGEWASGGEQTPFARLDWNQPIKVNKVVLFDRPNLIERIDSGVLSFSDGSTIDVTNLPDNGTAKEVIFSEKEITWVRFTVTSGVGPNVGLSEFQVFGSITSQGCSDCVNFNNVSLGSYSNQDADGSNTVSDGGKTVRLANNTWKRSNSTYRITSNTVISFDFKSNRQGEIHGIGFDEDNGLSSNRIFKVHGTQGWGIRTYDNYNNSGEYVTYTIPVGRSYTGNAMNLILVNDNDQGSGNTSYFRNVRIYENAGIRVNTKQLSANINEVDDEPNLVSKPQIAVYPNPFSNQFEINLSDDHDYSTIALYSISGQLLEKIDLKAGQGFIKFDSLQTLKKGLFIVQLIGKTTTKGFTLVKN